MKPAAALLLLLSLLAFAARADSNAVSYVGNFYVSAVPTNAVASPPSVNQPLGLFASIHLDAITNTVATASAGNYNRLTNYTAAITNGFAVALTNGFVTNLVAGFYRVTIHVSMIAGSSDTLECELFINNTGEDSISGFGSYDAPPRVRNMCATGIVYLAANSALSLRLNNRSNTDTINVWRAAITVGTP